MITEDYVSFEIAKLLKEKGFDELCKVWYAEYTSVWGGDSSGDRKYIKIQFDDKNRFDESYKFLCYAPTLQMAMKWLREVHETFISITYENDGVFTANLKVPLKGVDCMIDDKHNCWLTYEQAVDAAIKYCLEHLI